MKNIAIIPARGGSKRLPNKNILDLGGIPLLAHSIRYALSCGLIDEVYVTTDSAEIKRVAQEFGAKVIDRPQVLSGDLEPTVSALKHVLQTIGGGVDNVILLQPTNPLRPENLLSTAFDVFIEGNYDSLFSVTESSRKLGTISNRQFVPYNYEFGQRSQDMQALYFENGLLYISKPELILQDKIISETSFPFIVDHPYAAVDIDTADDFSYAEYLLNRRK